MRAISASCQIAYLWISARLEFRRSAALSLVCSRVSHPGTLARTAAPVEGYAMMQGSKGAGGDSSSAEHLESPSRPAADRGPGGCSGSRRPATRLDAQCVVRPSRRPARAAGAEPRSSRDAALADPPCECDAWPLVIGLLIIAPVTRFPSGTGSGSTFVSGATRHRTVQARHLSHSPGPARGCAFGM
jgi:hypothetical protein